MRQKVFGCGAIGMELCLQSFQNVMYEWTLTYLRKTWINNNVCIYLGCSFLWNSSKPIRSWNWLQSRICDLQISNLCGSKRPWSKEWICGCRFRNGLDQHVMFLSRKWVDLHLDSDLFLSLCCSFRGENKPRNQRVWGRNHCKMHLLPWTEPEIILGMVTSIGWQTDVWDTKMSGNVWK